MRWNKERGMKQERELKSVCVCVANAQPLSCLFYGNVLREQGTRLYEQLSPFELFVWIASNIENVFTVFFSSFVLVSLIVFTNSFLLLFSKFYGASINRYINGNSTCCRPTTFFFFFDFKIRIFVDDSSKKTRINGE